jgi:hypothetical protein
LSKIIGYYRRFYEFITAISESGIYIKNLEMVRRDKNEDEYI